MKLSFCPWCNNLVVPLFDVRKCSMAPRCGYKESVDVGSGSAVDVIDFVEVGGRNNDTFSVSEDMSGWGTTEIRCDKCNNNSAFFKQMQTRSADEPMTEFYKCTQCSHRWKQ